MTPIVGSLWDWMGWDGYIQCYIRVCTTTIQNYYLTRNIVHFNVQYFIQIL